MRNKLLLLWRRVRSSFWFVPSLMVAGAVALAFLNLYLDHTMSGVDGRLPRWFAVAGPESARSLLSTIAGSMITVAGVTFSIVIVALTLASSQFGPRLLSGFMQDTGNQLVLGTFISVFAYCVTVLIHLPGSAGSRNLPQTALMTATLLVAVAVGVLIFFFHHIAKSIHAGTLVEEAGAALVASVDHTLPSEYQEDEEPWPPTGFSESNAIVRVPRDGYLSRIDFEALSTLANTNEFRIMICPQAGAFLYRGEALVFVTPPDRMSRDIEAEIQSTCSSVERREEAEDLPLAIDRLVEIAVRSLSPGINDPYTAISVLHRLTIGVDRMLTRLPARYERRPRVFIRSPDVAATLECAFGPIRDYGRDDVRVLDALMRSLTTLGRRQPARHRAAIQLQLDRAREVARDSLSLADHVARIERHRIEA